MKYEYDYDAKGNVAAVLNTSQAAVATYRYNEFGALLSTSGTLDQPFRFSTQPYDETIGLVRYPYRFYAPPLGRWLSRDPIGISGGLNLYAFIGNNPVNFVDPLGLFQFGKAPLGPLPRMPGITTNPIDNYFNIELSHEHGFFEDGSGDNFGFFPNGRRVHTENPADYRFNGKHYDDDLMRDALRNLNDGKYSNWPWNKNNCQDWAERLREEYERLRKARESENCK